MTTIPIGKFSPRCPQCGEKLGVEKGIVDAKDETRVFCPVHGDVGSLQDIRAAVIEQNRDQIAAKARDYVSDKVGDMLRDAFRNSPNVTIKRR